MKTQLEILNEQLAELGYSAIEDHGWYIEDLNGNDMEWNDLPEPVRDILRKIQEIEDNESNL